MDIELGYYLSFLEDEFRGFSDVRIRVTPKTGTVRSPDLEQDYDPESKHLHVERGIHVLTRRRDYYFPFDWWKNRQHDRIHKQAEEIREKLQAQN
jgi:hypothetical protein